MHGPDAADTICAAVTKQSTSYAEPVCLLVCVVAVALAAQDGSCRAGHGIDTRALGIGAGKSIDIRWSARNGVDGVYVAGQHAEWQGLPAPSIVRGRGHCTHGGVGVERVAAAAFRGGCEGQDGGIVCEYVVRDGSMVRLRTLLGGQVRRNGEWRRGGGKLVGEVHRRASR